MKQVRESKAAGAISAYVIMKGARHIATVQAHNGASRVQVDIWHNDSTPYQTGSASGYGYDKFTAALSGLKIDGHTMANHCGDCIKRPKRGYFPADYKPRKGYCLANFAYYDSNGKRRDSSHWQQAARESLGESADWESVRIEAKRLQQSANLVGGYSDCYKESGLEYLRAIGYTVISAI